MAIETLNNGDLMSVQRNKLNNNFTFLTPIQTTATITTSWNGSGIPYTQSFNISGITESSVIDISLSESATVEQVEAFQNLNLVDGGQSTNYFTLRAFGTLNEIEIPITVLIRGGF